MWPRSYSLSSSGAERESWNPESCFPTCCAALTALRNHLDDFIKNETNAEDVKGQCIYCLYTREKEYTKLMLLVWVYFGHVSNYTNLSVWCILGNNVDKMPQSQDLPSPYIKEHLKRVHHVNCNCFPISVSTLLDLHPRRTGCLISFFFFLLLPSVDKCFPFSTWPAERQPLNVHLFKLTECGHLVPPGRERIQTGLKWHHLETPSINYLFHKVLMCTH